MIDYIIAKNILTEDEARKFFRQLVSALYQCHSSGIVHRDIKLENLLLTKQHDLLLSDFGLGAVVQKDQLLQTICGTPMYAPPELVSNDAYLGPPCDIWSAGVVLYIMLTGKPPFSSRDILRLYQKISNCEFHMPSSFSSNLKHLFKCIFVKSTVLRLNIEQLRNHPWVKGDLEPPEIIPARISLQDDPKKLREIIERLSIDEGTKDTPTTNVQNKSKARLCSQKEGRQRGSTVGSHEKPKLINQKSGIFAFGKKFNRAMSHLSDVDSSVASSFVVSRSTESVTDSETLKFMQIVNKANQSVTQTSKHPKLQKNSSVIAMKLDQFTKKKTPSQLIPKNHQVSPLAIQVSKQDVFGIASLRSLRYKTATIMSKLTPQELMNCLEAFLSKENISYHLTTPWIAICEIKVDRETVKFEAEVHKIAMFKTTGLRLKRLYGSAIHYKNVYNKTKKRMK